MASNDYDNLDSIPLAPPVQNYQHLALKVDPSMLEGSKFVFEGDESKKRSLGEIMFFSIGTSYITGLTTGGFWGLVEHYRTFDGTSAVLKRNHLLNSITKRGTFLGNSLGVVALLYTASSGLIGKFARDGKDDIVNDIAGGMTTGAIYKCTKGRQVIPFIIAGAFAGFMCNVIGSTINEGVSHAPQIAKEAMQDTVRILTGKD